MYIKVNVDGSIFYDMNKVGIGLIIHASLGVTLQSLCCDETGIQESADIECLAILRGLQFCLGMEFKRLIVKSDQLSMVQACNSDVLTFLEMSSMIIEIKRCSVYFEECLIQHIYREQNMPIHLLACHAWSIDLFGCIGSV